MMLKRFNTGSSTFGLMLFIFFAAQFVTAFADSPRMGVLVPLTGESASSYGAQVRDGVLLARELSSLPKVELIFEDSQCQRQAALTAAKKLVELDQVRMIIGDVCWTDLVAQVTEPKQVLMLSTGSAQSSVRDAGDYVFRLKLDVSVDSRAVARPLLEQARVRKAALLFAQDNWGEGIASNFTDEFQKLGGQVVAQEGFMQDCTDFRPFLLRLKIKQPQVVMISAYPPQVGLITRQARELGLDMKFAAYGAAVGAEALKLGGSSMDGLLFMAEFDADSERPVTRKFGEDFKLKYGQPPTLFGAMGFDAYNLYALGLVKCGLDTKCIRDYFYSLRDYAGASGSIGFDDHGDVLKPLKFKKVWQGGFIDFNGK